MRRKISRANGNNQWIVIDNIMQKSENMLQFVVGKTCNHQ